MKARLSPASLPQMYLDAANEIAKQQIQADRAKFGEIISHVAVGASVLALSDVFGFGQERAQRFANAFSTILDGYVSEYHDGLQAEMDAELKRRGIAIVSREGGTNDKR